MRSVFLAVLALAAPALADELRLEDGRVLVGKVVAKGDALVVRTRHGDVTVDPAAVVSRRTEAELLAELRRLEQASGDSAGHELELARVALRYGLTQQMWKHLDRCLEKLPADESAAQRRCRAFLATLEPETLPDEYREKDTSGRVRGLVRLARRHTSPAKRAATIELLVHEKDADETLRFCAHRESFPEQRLAALEALARRPDEQNQLALCKALVIDKERDVRVGTADLVNRHGDPVATVQYLAPGFLSNHPSIRGRTAQAYKYLKHQAGAPYLVAAGPVAGLAAGGQIGVRAHMFSITQRAYIRDFEVEIAQAAAVANPIVANVSNGVVLDVKVGGVWSNVSSIVDAYRNALQEITGQDPGPDPATWRAWWYGLQAQQQADDQQLR